MPTGPPFERTTMPNPMAGIICTCVAAPFANAPEWLRTVRPLGVTPTLKP